MTLAMIGGAVSGGIVGWLASEAGYGPLGIFVWVLASALCNAAIVLGGK